MTTHKLNAHIFQHVPFEGPGAIQDWLKSRKAKITTTRFYAGGFPPDLDEVDLLIVMGGPMSVNDSDEYPWLELEKVFIRAAIEAGKPVFGICLGAQLIASAMGAKVFRASETEIGWFPIFGTKVDSPFRFPEELTVFHWHGETFDLPPNADLLASTPEVPHQAFQLKDKKVLGLQFHLESTSKSLKEICKHCAEELVAGKKIMSADEIKSLAEDYLEADQTLLFKLLDGLVD